MFMYVCWDPKSIDDQTWDFYDMQFLVIQEAHGPHHSPEKPVQINKHICWKLWLNHNIDLEIRKTMILFIIKWSLFEKPWVPFTQGCFVPSLVEIGPLVFEKKMKMWNVYKHTTDNRRTEKLTWVFSSEELIKYIDIKDTLF